MNLFRQICNIKNIFLDSWIGSKEEREKEVEVTLPVISGRPSNVAVPIENFPDFPVPG